MTSGNLDQDDLRRIEFGSEDGQVDFGDEGSPQYLRGAEVQAYVCD